LQYVINVDGMMMRIATPRRALAPALAVLTVVGLLALASTGSTAARTSASGSAAPTIDVGVAISASDDRRIEIGTAASMLLAQLLKPPGSTEPLYLPPDLVNDVTWVTQTATEPDPTTNPANKITGRTSFMLQSAIIAGLTRLGSVSCVGFRAANPTSDHPAGKACDLMFAYDTPAGVEAGWRAANWLTSNQAVLGVRYVIWQGMIWNARSKPGPWTQYASSAYGCPNPANITGCHYDHVHVSMF
jgi:hypothetical protein